MKVIRINKVDSDLLERFNKFFPEQKWQVDQSEKFVSDPNNILLLGFEGEIIAGFLTAHRLQRLDERIAEVLLYEIEVNPNFKRKGVGSQLVNELKIISRDAGWMKYGFLQIYQMRRR